MRIILLATLAAALAVPLGAGAQVWQEVAIPDGPSPATPRVMDAAMDGGTLWLAMKQDGLMAYDGASWVLHTTADGGLRSNWRNTIFVDRDGGKWTSKDNLETPAPTVDRLDDGGTFSVKTDDTWTYYNAPAQLASRRPFSVAQDLAGNMWFGIRDENGDADVVSMFELLIENGPGTGDDEWLHFGDTFDPGIFTSEDVRGIEIDQQNRLWITYDRAGVDVWDFGDYESFDDDTIVHYGVLEGLPSDAVYAVHTGHDGRVWAGGDNGIAVFDSGAGEWSRIEDLTVDRVYDIDTDAQGHIWIGTDGGVVMVYASGEVARVYGTAEGLPDDVVSMVAVDQLDGTVWAVSGDPEAGETSLFALESGFGPERRIFAYPNPWNEHKAAEKDIKILGAPDGSTVEIFDLTGESVRKLEATREPFRWDSLDADLNEVASGVYIVRVVTPTGEQVFTKVAIVR
jgi:hypothetical protein